MRNSMRLKHYMYVDRSHMFISFKTCKKDPPHIIVLLFICKLYFMSVYFIFGSYRLLSQYILRQ